MINSDHACKIFICRRAGNRSTRIGLRSGSARKGMSVRGCVSVSSPLIGYLESPVRSHAMNLGEEKLVKLEAMLSRSNAVGGGGTAPAIRDLEQGHQSFTGLSPEKRKETIVSSAADAVHDGDPTRRDGLDLCPSGRDAGEHGLGRCRSTTAHRGFGTRVIAGRRGARRPNWVAILSAPVRSDIVGIFNARRRQIERQGVSVICRKMAGGHLATLIAPRWQLGRRCVPVSLRRIQRTRSC